MKDAEKAELAAAAVKVDKKQIQYNNRLLREKTKADNAEKAARKREETAQKKAQEQREKDDRAAEKARIKALKDAQKVYKSPKQARKKTSKKPQSRISKGGSGATRRRPQVVHEPGLAPQGVTTRAGRMTRPTNKLR
ncbi:hypothetical protein EJ07DRAFT_155638 [Lizonia empirigonia]|nr:hypothetical protein EJ07DRAFT_155638 [Lizonia empirigonia]